MTDKITGALFTEMVLNGAAAIEAHREEINELNVFPVPDGDTGTNMSLTMANGAKECEKKSASAVSEAADAAAGGLLRGARGNSGVIMSLLFRGISKTLKEKQSATAEEFAAAMRAGVDTAYKAVMKPAEGTILTVSRLAADAAAEAAKVGSDAEYVLEEALKAGHIALEDTVNINPVLKKAGVVDSGGKGYLYILEGMLQALRGEKAERKQAAEQKEKADFSDFNEEDINFTYCTEFIVSRTNEKDAGELRRFLNERGDSIVVVDDEEIIKTHVHTDEPGVVLTEALTYGTLLTVKIENMREQHTAKVIETEPAEEIPVKPYGMVAVCAGSGMAEAFRSIGVDAIVTGGQTMNPSTADILEQIEAIPAETVFVLPNNKNIIMAAQQSVPLAGKQVVVIPTATVPQGITAALTFDGAADTEANTEAMTEAAAAVHTAQITYAARDSEFDGHSIRAGEYLSLLDGSLVSNGTELQEVLNATLERMNSLNPELVTVYYGEDVTEEQAAEVAAQAEAVIPDAEVNVAFGGQPVYYYIISAE